MHSVVVTITVAIGAFVSTMIDNFVAFAAQLALTEPKRVGRASSGQFSGVLALIGMAGILGAALFEIPLRWVSVLALVPLALAVHAWRGRNKPLHAARRGWITTFLITVSLGGDNLAIWIPILRSNGLRNGLLTAAILALCDIVLIVLARVISQQSAVVSRAQSLSRYLTPVLYVALSVVIVWECGLF